MKRTPKTLYEKKGKKFVPVGTDDILTYHPEGDYLVRVRKSSKKMSCKGIPIKIDWAGVEMVLDECADAVASAIQEHGKQELSPRPHTALERKAWDAYCKVLKTDKLTFSRKSACEIAQNAVKCLRKNLKGKSECPDGCIDVYAER